ncbi:MAG: class I SAM-dependent methyltransferase [Burkholderiaceae bacterium]
MMDLTEYRSNSLEQQRTADLLSLVPQGLESVLDVGARDGHFSKLLTSRCERVTALDLQRPTFDIERVTCVAGDACALEFGDDHFDLVFCAEVLEHIPPESLAKACAELSRVSGRYLLIGVPDRQDIRHGRTTCGACGTSNPPWGHVNSFDEPRLHALFSDCVVARRSLVGSTKERTNALSAALMNWAGNPYGTYSQEETCGHCSAPVLAPASRSWLQKVATRVAFKVDDARRPFLSARGNWIHLLLEKKHIRAASGQTASARTP